MELTDNSRTPDWQKLFAGMNNACTQENNIRRGQRASVCVRIRVSWRRAVSVHQKAAPVVEQVKNAAREGGFSNGDDLQHVHAGKRY